MSKITSRSQAAEACLEYNQTFSQVYVTSDLQCFQSKHDAVNHARTLHNTSIEEYKRDQDSDDDQEPAQVKLTAEATIALIMAALSEEEIEIFLGDDTRKTVIAAAAKQRQVLKQQALDEQAAEADRARLEREGANPGGQEENTENPDQNPAE